MGLGGPGGVLKVLGVFRVSQGGVWGPGDGILGVRMCWKGGLLQCQPLPSRKVWEWFWGS